MRLLRILSYKIDSRSNKIVTYLYLVLQSKIKHLTIYSNLKYAIIATISNNGDDNTFKNILNRSIIKMASADDFAQLPVVGNIGVIVSENATRILSK